RGRCSADTGPRVSASPGRSRQILLEERQVVARDRAVERRQARILGALRLQQRRRSLARTAVRLLARITHPRDEPGAWSVDIRGVPPSPIPIRKAAHWAAFLIVELNPGR